ncbi:uncharacterized protein MEPE_02916 [Melanopsichium pennsylvanicum]|uniref:Uncharacterized protein n=1 Tax=Melanopsichium pennsylvanicum TaxID=63383 RepID=A0AAJ5C551_9BASI|nr:uncharacterized protein MEPE_02916 [Melanopsichium pennsylvanicum]
MTQPNRSRVIGFGSNLFSQLGDEYAPTKGSSLHKIRTPLYTIDNARSIVAVCTYQTIYRTHANKVEAIGEFARLLNKVLYRIYPDASLETHLYKAPILVGRDMIQVALDVEAKIAHFIHYDNESIIQVEMKHQWWLTAAADGRGRIMAINQKNHAFLFDSIHDFQAATQSTEKAHKLREDRKFLPYRLKPDRTLEAIISDQRATLPSFTKVSAGDSHFVLTAHQPGKEDQNHVVESALWIFGDARFGAVPANAFHQTQLVCKMSTQPSDATLMDVEYIMPLVLDHVLNLNKLNVTVGSRHTLIWTNKAEVYGWGWNDDCALQPFSHPNQPQKEHEERLQGKIENIISEPTLIHSIPTNCTKSRSDSWGIAASKDRSMIWCDGKLFVTGSNEFACLGLETDLQGLQKKRQTTQREFSQIPKTFECVNGFQNHPCFQNRDNVDARVVKVYATSLATFLEIDQNGLSVA